jgi:ribosomal protein S18
VAWVDYKNIPLLRRYLSERGRIRARQATGNCAQHQEEISAAIKTARELVLLPYAPRTAKEATATTTSEPLEMVGTTKGDRP